MQFGCISVLLAATPIQVVFFLLCKISKYTKVTLLLISAKCEKASGTVDKSLHYNAEISFFCPEFVRLEFKLR